MNGDTQTQHSVSMTTPAPNKTMFSYFTKLPSKACMVEDTNPRKLAPVFNKQHVEEFIKNKLEQFDAELLSNFELKPVTKPTTNYIASIKSGQHKPFKLDKKPRGPLRVRLFQYHEDVRPPYFGTWQKRSKLVTGRRPFGQDGAVFDYEVDSEAEWDIGGPGESLKGDDSEDEEELDDYEIDMKTFVPHGYVSDDEVEVHSDLEENQSANQSIEENCDGEENSNASVEIIAEKRLIQKNDQQEQKHQHHNHRQATVQDSPAQPPPVKQTKLEIKPIVLGLNYEDEPPTISESKLQFLRAFKGFHVAEEE